MANYATLKAAIEAAIYENHDNEITGDMLQETLIAMVNSLGSGYQFMGIATITTNPGTPDYNVVYLAGAGRYINFNNLVVPENNIGVLSYNGSWSLQTLVVGGSNGLIDVVENGLYVVDENLNIGVAIDSTGLHAINSLNYTIE